MQSVLLQELFSFNKEATKPNLGPAVYAPQAGCPLAASAGWQALPDTGWADFEVGKGHDQLREAYPDVPSRVRIRVID